MPRNQEKKLRKMILSVNLFNRCIARNYSILIEVFQVAIDYFVQSHGSLSFFISITHFITIFVTNVTNANFLVSYHVLQGYLNLPFNKTPKCGFRWMLCQFFERSLWKSLIIWLVYPDRFYLYSLLWRSEISRSNESYRGTWIKCIRYKM